LITVSVSVELDEDLAAWPPRLVIVRVERVFLAGGEHDLAAGLGLRKRRQRRQKEPARRRDRFIHSSPRCSQPQS